MVSRFEVNSVPPVRGFLHVPDALSGDALVLAHGAGSNCNAPLLVAVAAAFTDAGFTVLRCDLPYRQKRPHGPPFPAEAAQDREGLVKAVAALRAQAGAAFRRVFLGGHSYGGRQATMLAAEDPEFAARINGLLLVSWPAMLENSLRWVFGVSGRPFCAEAQRQVESLEGRSAPRPLLPRRGRICGPAKAGSLHSQARRERVQGRGAETSAYQRRLP